MNAFPRVRPLWAALVAASLLTACGAKGPLFLPPPPPTEEAPPALPAAEPTAPDPVEPPVTEPTPTTNEP